MQSGCYSLIGRGVWGLFFAQFSLAAHHSRVGMISSSNATKGDAHGMDYYSNSVLPWALHPNSGKDCRWGGGAQSSDGHHTPTLPVVEALGFSIFDHGPVKVPEIGKMVPKALRAQCVEVPCYCQQWVVGCIGCCSTLRSTPYVRSCKGSCWSVHPDVFCGAALNLLLILKASCDASHWGNCFLTMGCVPW